jgi:retron-type reverse transcriptase
VRALRRVEQNAGAAGIDGMTTDELRSWLHEHWPAVRVRLEAGTYRPQPVRRVAIPKPSGGERLLGVPTALDRLIQQALSQVLSPVFDPCFSERSFGFGLAARRIRRSSAHASPSLMVRCGWSTSIWTPSSIASSTTR